MGIRTSRRTSEPTEVVVEHVTEGTVTPFEFRIYYADGNYDLGSYRTKDHLVNALRDWLLSEGYSDMQIGEAFDKLPRSRSSWEFTIKL